MKVMITGGSGRVGRALTSFLSDEQKTGEPVFAMSLDSQPPAERGHAWHIPADVESLEVLYDITARMKPDAIVHLAANPLPFGVARHKQFVGNLGTVFGITQVALDLGVERLVVASSERAAGWSSEGHQPPHYPYDEEVVIPTSNGYSMGKKLGEDVVAGLALQNPEMRAASLRLNFVLAQPMKEPLPGEAHAFHDRFSAHMWGFVRAEDTASAIWAAIQHAPKGHSVYSIASRSSLGITPVRELLAAKFGEVNPVADWLPEFGAVVDSRKAERELGWVAQLDWRDHS